MKILLRSLAFAVLFVNATFAGNKAVNVSGATGIALQGYDPVAFFTAGKPTHGSPSIQAECHGATYLFASEANKAQFEKNPLKYAPQFGGYCAYGVAVGALFPVDIDTWQIKNGKLYVNLNPEILKAFNMDLKGNIAKANANWPDLIASKAEGEGKSRARAGSGSVRGR